MTDKESRLATFQNMYLIAAADGKLEAAEKNILLKLATQLQLSTNDLSPILGQFSDLDFILPPTEAERKIELRQLIELMLSDGDMDEREEELCREFAKQCDISPEEYSNILNKTKDERYNNRRAIRRNLVFYKNVYTELSRIEQEPKLLAQNIIDIFQNKITTPSKNLSLDKAIYQFAYLLFVRMEELDKTLLQQIPQYLELILAEKFSMEKLKLKVLETEMEKGKEEIRIIHATQEKLRSDIGHFARNSLL